MRGETYPEVLLLQLRHLPKKGGSFKPENFLRKANSSFEPENPPRAKRGECSAQCAWQQRSRDEWPNAAKNSSPSEGGQDCSA